MCSATMSPSSPPASTMSQKSPEKLSSKKRKRGTESQDMTKSFTAAECVANELSCAYSVVFVCFVHFLTVFVFNRYAESGGFLWRRFTIDIPLAPVHSGDLREGIEQVLDKWISRYVPTLGFVLLSVNHESLVCPKSARLLPPGAMALAQGVTFEALGWRPTVGSKLKGRIMHSTRSNISLIINNTFNAVIESQHIPTDLFTWDSEKTNPIPPYEPLEDDFYKDMFQQEEQEEAAEAATAQVEGATEGLEELALQQKQKAEQEPESVIGCWVHKSRNEPVGSEEGMLEFTVIG